MSVEMERLEIMEIINDDINGWFSVEVENYDYMVVEYECRNGDLLFKCYHKWNEERFSKWLLNEGKAYKTFLLNYLDEFKKVYNQVSFKGILIEETSYEDVNTEYEFVIQYDGIPNNVKWLFVPELEEFRLFYQIPIPINSRGKYGGGFIEDALEYKTIQRMWEPFRNKTKYRLQLLHMLR